MENVVIHKEIDLIQSCIQRMAHNSFLLKGWTISLIAVILALSSDSINTVSIGMLSLIPLVSFWYLDAFFLRTEKMYRKMYEWVLDKRLKDDVTFLYDLNPHRFKDEVDSTWAIMWSVTLRWFYFIPITLILGIIGMTIKGI